MADHKWIKTIPVLLIMTGVLHFSIAMPGWTEGEEAASGGGGVNANTGLSSGSIIGNGSMQSNDTGVAVNGEVKDSNLNNNQNALSNRNILNPTVIAPSGGGSSALVLPRNPLPMPNAALGRSNFGMQVGVQNNPGLGPLTGGGNALGWFMQAGLTIPFGKIPDVYNNGRNAQLDDMRRQKRAASRNVFGGMNPGTQQNQVETKVRGKVVGLSAYNYTSLPSGKVGLAAPSMPSIDIPQPKVLALAPADVYSRPLNTGDKVGMIEVGREYPYLGHTRSGWVKVLLPNGAEGWTSTHFEYIKYDFTEIDTLAVDPKAAGKPKTAEQQAVPVSPVLSNSTQGRL